MAGTLVNRGNILYTVVFNTTLTPASVAANTSAEQSFTVAGLQTTDQISAIGKPTVQAGLFIAQSRIPSANTLGVTFGNLTGTALTPTAAEVYTIEVNRPEVPALPTNAV